MILTATRLYFFLMNVFLLGSFKFLFLTIISLCRKRVEKDDFFFRKFVHAIELIDEGLACNYKGKFAKSQILTELLYLVFFDRAL